MRKLAISLLVLLSFSCGPKPNPTPPPPPSDGDVCTKACAAWTHFAEYDDRCKTEAEGSSDGTSCIELCKEVESTDWTTMYPQCIPKAKDCMQAKEFSSKGCD